MTKRTQITTNKKWRWEMKRKNSLCYKNPVFRRLMERAYHCWNVAAKRTRTGRLKRWKYQNRYVRRKGWFLDELPF